MTHLGPETLLDLALDLLAPQTADSARAHLSECAECSQAFTVLEEEQRVLRVVASQEPAMPSRLEVGIVERLRRHVRPRAPRILVAAAALFVVAAGLFLLRPDDPQKVTMLEQVRTSELMALGLEEGR
jgi:predicted anti-sigma-YlaC factor YlaD